eukprot:193923-Rhodomonas_salina.1
MHKRSKHGTKSTKSESLTAHKTQQSTHCHPLSLTAHDMQRQCRRFFSACIVMGNAEAAPAGHLVDFGLHREHLSWSGRLLRPFVGRLQAREEREGLSREAQLARSGERWEREEKGLRW